MCRVVGFGIGVEKRRAAPDSFTLLLWLYLMLAHLFRMVVPCTIALLALTACTPTATVTTQRTLTQAALVPAPRGPVTQGPVARSGEVVVGGHMSSTFGSDVGETRADDALANITPVMTFGGQLGVGVLDTFEIGLAFDIATPRTGSFAAASDLSETTFNDQVTWRMGPTLRAIPLGDQTLGLGFLAELQFSSISYWRREQSDVFVTDLTGDKPSTQFLGSTDNAVTDSAFFVFTRVGMFVTGGVGDWTFTGGGLLQLHPMFWGERRVDSQCDIFGANDRDATAAAPPAGRLFLPCRGVTDPDDVSPLETALLVTLYVGASYRLDPLVLTARFHVHTAESYDLSATTPLGFDLGAQLRW